MRRSARLRKCAATGGRKQNPIFTGFISSGFQFLSNLFTQHLQSSTGFFPLRRGERDTHNAKHMFPLKPATLVQQFWCMKEQIAKKLGGSTIHAVAANSPRGLSVVFAAKPLVAATSGGQLFQPSTLVIHFRGWMPLWRQWCQKRCHQSCWPHPELCRRLRRCRDAKDHFPGLNTGHSTSCRMSPCRLGLR